MLPYEVHVDAIEEESERIGELAEHGVKVAIRSVPGWDFEALLRHLVETFNDANEQLASSEITPPHDDIETGRDALEDFEDSRLAIVARLREREPSDLLRGTTGEETTADLARRLAHESALHRVDAELARGAATTVDAELAEDGIAERLEVVLVQHQTEAELPALGGSICLICSDRDAAWTVDTSRGRFRVRPGRGPADAAVVATASDLFCFAWSRPTIRPLQVTGQMAVVEAWQSLPGELSGLEGSL